MEALILSCGTGGGHNSACTALVQELSSRGHGVMALNPYMLKGEKTADTVNNAYILLAQKAPAAFGMVYGLGNAYRKLPISSPVYHLNRRMVPLLENYINEKKYDVIATTHLFPAEIITHMKRQGKTVPTTFFIATDYTCIPFTEETDCDFYVIPSPELTDEFVSRGILKERILPLGIPVQRQFREKVDRIELRRSLGLETDKKYILIAGGSIGAGQIEEIVPMLLRHYDDSVRLIVVCGNNPSLYQSLERLYSERCILLSYTEHMASYMRCCDLFLSKPGGLSSTEAAVVGTALIHITPIPGCETRNMDFFARNGMCLAVSSPKRQLLFACDKLFDETNRQRMRENQSRIVPANAASDICDLMEKEYCRQKTESVRR